MLKSILILLLFAQVPQSTLGPGPAGITQLQELITRIINLVVEFGFIALIFMLIAGGIRFLTSGGDAKATQAAGQTITWALLGILFLVLAILILKIISVFTGVDLTHFEIGFPGAPTLQEWGQNGCSPNC